MGVMDLMVKSLGRERREAMMMEMMPLMMDGIDLHEFMPKMMGAMLGELTPEGVVQFLNEALGEKETAKKLLGAIQGANLMGKMMFARHESRLPFEETVERLHSNAEENGWQVPDIRNLQGEYLNSGLADMTKCKVVYLCNPHGGYAILQQDEYKAMSVMMPMGVSVYETTDGRVEIAVMNLGMMSHMFEGPVRDVLADGAKRFEASLEGIV